MGNSAGGLKATIYHSIHKIPVRWARAQILVFYISWACQSWSGISQLSGQHKLGTKWWFYSYIETEPAIFEITHSYVLLRLFLLHRKLLNHPLYLPYQVFQVPCLSVACLPSDIVLLFLSSPSSVLHILSVASTCIMSMQAFTQVFLHFILLNYANPPSSFHTECWLKRRIFCSAPSPPSHTAWV